MNIDDQEMIDSTAESPVEDLMTTTPLYFGGVPAAYSIADGGAPTTLRTVGCIGDVTVNERWLLILHWCHVDDWCVSVQ